MGKNVVLRDWLNSTVLLASMLLGGTFAILLGKDLGWDLANYHFYQPYAVLNDRATLDSWPVSYLQQFFSPTLDFFSYYLITSAPPRLTVFILGAIHGLNLWLLFLIARLFIPAQGALVIAGLGMLGPMVLPGMGSFQNDNLIAVFVLAAVYLILREQHFTSGILLGVAIGLKLTNAIYLPALMAGRSCEPQAKQLRAAMTAGGIAIGIFVTSGYWMLHLWQYHHNPVFPFFNRFFHSSDFITQNFFDNRFMPQTIAETLFYPFYFSMGKRISELPFRDIRILMVYCLLILWIGKHCITRKYDQPKPLLYSLIIFFTLSYLCWEYIFSYARYMVALELLAPLMIYLLIKELCESTRLAVSIAIACFSLMLIILVPVGFTRSLNYEGSYFNIHIPENVKKVPVATVLIPYSAYALTSQPEPLQYFIPSFPRQWHVIGIPFKHGKLAEDEKSTALARKGPMFFLASKNTLAKLETLGKAKNCETLTSDRQKLIHEDIVLCQVETTQSG